MRPRRVQIGIGLLALLACLAALGLPLGRAMIAPRAQAAAFVAARDAWAARPFRRYRMVIEQRWSGIVTSPCRQQFDVEYDAQLGYPRSLRLTSRPGPFDRWLRWPPLATPVCTNAPRTGPQHFTVISLTSLP